MKKFLIFLSLIITMIVAGISPAVYAAGIPWQNPKMIYTYVPSNDKYSSMMKDAFAYWTRITNGKIVFKYVDNPQKALIKVRFVKDAEKTSNIENAIGVTYPKIRQICYNGKCKKYMAYATIEIASNVPNGTLMKNDSVSRVMIHEVGHAIGLGHSSDTMSIMYYQKGKRGQTITKSDLNALAKLYGWN